MRVLVTGCNGQVGHLLSTKLMQHNQVELLAVDRDELDITDRDSVFQVVENFKPDFIFNAAAHTAVDKAETEIDLSFAINELGPKYLAEAAQSVNGAILHISTDYVFAGNKNGLYVESDTTDPQSVYGESKLAGELAVINACDNHIIMRTAWVFSEQGNNFVKTMLRLGAERPELGIIDDQFGGPTYSGDIADALIQIAVTSFNSNEFHSGVYNFSGSPHVSWFDFADNIFDVALKHNVIKAKPTLNRITTEQYPTPAKRPENSKLDCTKINSVFSIEESDWKMALESIKEYT